ncbi:hypothetical protein BKK47_02625 [Rodentibacter mrazii]|uniref:Phage neck terminator protein gp12-like domain-containing protein n=1 Tax=Rodentibacter mrazii TaxID=1908257 RepID=A0A1V3IIN4_9PAST|nr:hypothetical protein BKK47_02625 [Rodentibacter mrazii]
MGGYLPENHLSAFITVDVLFSQEIGQSRRKFDGTTEYIISSLQSTISISCYGNNSLAIATKLKTLLQSSNALSALKAMNAGIVSFSDVRNLTATVGADYEERGQFDCVISHHHIVATPLDPIKQVDHYTNQSIQQTIKGAI